MCAGRQAFPEKVVVLLLLTTAAQSAVLTDNLQTTATPNSNSSLTIQLSNSSMEEPQVLRVHKPCGSEHDGYCTNGGTCMFPQDNEKPSCICAPAFSGPRCMLIQPIHSVSSETEQVIGIIIGVLMLIVFLAIAIYFFAYRRCKKSAPLIKPAPSETSV